MTWRYRRFPIPKPPLDQSSLTGGNNKAKGGSAAPIRGPPPDVAVDETPIGRVRARPGIKLGGNRGASGAASRPAGSRKMALLPRQELPMRASLAGWDGVRIIHN